MKKMSKFLCFVLVFAMIVSVLPLSAFADDEPADLNWVKIPGQPGGWERVSSVADGDEVRIVLQQSTRYLTSTVSSNRLALSTDEASAVLWTFHDDGMFMYLTAQNGSYMDMGNGSAGLNTTAVPLYLSYNASNGYWDIGVVTSTNVSRTTNGYSSYTGGNYYIKDDDGFYHVVTKIENTTSGSGMNQRQGVKVYWGDDDDECISYTASNWLSSVSFPLYTPTNCGYHLNDYQNSHTTAGGYNATASSNAGSRWYLETQLAPEANTYAALDAEDLTFNVRTFSDQAALEAAIKEQITVYLAQEADGAVDPDSKESVSDYTLTIGEGLDLGNASQAACTVTYADHELGSFNVVIEELPITGVTLNEYSGMVSVDAHAGTPTSATMSVTYEDGFVKEVPVTVGMLSGDFDVSEIGIYEGLTVTYGGEVLTNDFTLEVLFRWTEIDVLSDMYTPVNSLDELHDGDQVILQVKNQDDGYIQNEIRSERYNWSNSAYGFGLTTKNGAATWTIEVGSDGNRYLKDENGKYLAFGSNYAVSLATTPSSGTHKGYLTKNANEDYFNVYNGSSRYLNRYYNTSTNIINGYNDRTSNASRINVYKRVAASKIYAGMTGDTAYRFLVGYTQDEVENTIRSNLHVYVADDAMGTNMKETQDYTLVPSKSYNPDLDGEEVVYDVIVSGKSIGQIAVSFIDPAMHIESVTLHDDVGHVLEGASDHTKTNAKLDVVYADGSTDQVDITLDMLEGFFDKDNDGTYTDLTVNFAGVSVEGFTLVVDDNDYPEYPDEGSVRVGKTGSGIRFPDTGVAEVELSATGVPMNKPVDVIVMLDTSSSMTKDASNKSTSDASKQRIALLKNSLVDMVAEFKLPNPDGTPSDIRVAIADFNGYTDLNGNNTSRNVKTVFGETWTAQDNQARIYTGTVTRNVTRANYTSDLSTAFEDVHDIDIDAVNSTLHTTSGTNYDYAFDTVYELGAAIQAKNEENGEDRELIVIFMSDGGAWQYNYFYSTNNKSIWNKWILGDIYGGSSITDRSTYNYFYDSFENNRLGYTSNGSYSNYSSGQTSPYNYFYNDEPDEAGVINSHRMANAIKGKRNEMFEVIKPASNSADWIPGKEYMIEVPGLGATLYTISFCIYDDGKMPAETALQNIRELASLDEHGERLYFDANDQDSLTAAFNRVSRTMKQAATNAYFMDTMGEDYDLYMDPDEHHEGHSNQITPSIQVKQYDIFTDSDIGGSYNGVDITSKMVGQRYGDPTILENITFGHDDSGNVAVYSDLIGGGNTNILGADGVIRAKHFLYNTNLDHAVTLNAADETIKIDTETLELPAETFYWYLGTLGEKELALSYNVYLTDTMEGKRPAGRYPTNKSATLYYKSWLGHDAHKDTVSPILPWDAATVNYAFYLVDANGNPIVNRTTGETGTFENKIAITDPVEFAKLYLNTTTTLIGGGDGKNITVPEGFSLYDEGAEYSVTVNSGTENPSNWEITKGKDPATTYVTGYNGSASTNDLTGTDPNYDYTHTTVWFAVVFEVKCIDDVVVIDYGLPVNISVLENDMFGTNGSLAGIAWASDIPANRFSAEAAGLNSAYGMSIEGNYGSASVSGAQVVYSINTMKMDMAEKLSYAVHYVNNAISGVSGYYYGAVTVIPATTIYYEDNFTVTYSEDDGGTTKGWEALGTAPEAAKQDEDRPGAMNVSKIDANNVYGYDPVNGSCASYSLNAAHKTTVAANGNPKNPEKATATFSFKGTGFDVIAMTDNTSGFVTAKVYDADNKCVATKLVNNYFQTTGDYEELYQIPVIKVDGLDYGEYTAVLTVSYNKQGDPEGNGSTTFVLDAIRIYDPAGHDEIADSVVKDAYVQDKEYAPIYTRIREILTGKEYLEGITDVDFGACFVEVKGETGDLLDYYDESYEVTVEFDPYDEESLKIPHGPNNECYLAYGQAIAFDYEFDANTVASIQLGAKAPFGPTKLLVTVVTTEGKQISREIAINTATDMNYDFSNLFNLTEGGKYTVIISGRGENIVSLTTLKTAYVDAPVSVALTVSNDTLKLTKSILTKVFAAPEPIVAPEEPEVFEPASFSVSLGKGNVKIGKKLSITVTTSGDVAAVTVNGAKASLKKTDKKTGKCTWTYDYVAKSSGDNELEIVAINADGLASAPIVEKVSVQGSVLETLKNAVVTTLNNVIERILK